MKKPSFFKGKYMGSVFQNSEHEWIWNNIIVILSRTGNVWKELSWNEYVIERKKDKGFNEYEEKGRFEKVLEYTINSQNAEAFTNPNIRRTDGIPSPALRISHFSI